MRVPHPSTFLAAFRLLDTLRTHPGLHILHAHPTGCWLPHRRSPHSHPNWFPGAVKGLAANKLPVITQASFLLIGSASTSLIFSVSVSRRRCCTCARCSTPSCLRSSGPSTASRRPLLRLRLTRTRQSSPPVPSSRVWSSGVGSLPASCS